MSIKNFSENLFARISGESETVKIATHEILTGGEIGNMRMMIYKQGNPGGTIKIVCYHRGNVANPVCQSNTVSFSGITENFLGFLRFDFNRENIYQNSVLDIYAVISGYSRNGDTDYFSMIFDFPSPIYDNSI